jgi:soluble lytic murein transglycosylase
VISGRAGFAGLLALAFALVGARAAFSPQSRPDLQPTVHQVVPVALESVWLAPTEATQAAMASGAYGPLQEGVRRCLEEDFEAALSLLVDPVWPSTPLAAYAAYYAGRARLGLEQYAEARLTFEALIDTRPAGYVGEAALIGAAEAAEGLDEPEAALRLYEIAASRRALSGASVWLKIGQIALALGAHGKAAEALLRVYYEYPLSEEADQAATELLSLRAEIDGPGTETSFPRDLERADRLWRAGRWQDARAAYLELRGLATGDDRVFVDVRTAGTELNLRRYRTAVNRLLPHIARETPYRAEARFVHARATRALGHHREFVTQVGDLVHDHPDSPWAQAALDALATHYILLDDDAKAAEIFRDLYERYPTGPYSERAAWKAGWWAYRHDEWAGAVGLFEGAAAAFPRSDYRPAWLYWSGRARQALGDTAVARARLALAVIDYGSSYYGRLAAEALARLPMTATSASGAPDLQRAPSPVQSVAFPPTEGLIRMLIAAELYDAALLEIAFAGRQWSHSTLLDASRALVLNKQGELRSAITLLKRTYPQYLTARGADLPVELLRVIYPVAYWPLVQKYSTERGLDPCFVAALIAQESTFDASARSSANAYGLMQLLPATARRVGRTIGLRSVTTRSLVDPETNLRLGTAYFAALLEEFGETHLALAAYNAGERRVRAWVEERQGLPDDEFIDDIPFPETQNYVRRVLGTAADYCRLYGER